MAAGDMWGNQPTWKTMKEEDEFQLPFTQLITFMLGSKTVSQELKDEFINSCLPIKKFREHLTTFYPDYVDKVKLWEKLHGE